MFWWGFTPKIDPNLAQGSNLLKYLWSTFITPHPAWGRVFRINSMPFVLKGENYKSSVWLQCISWFVQWNNSILHYLSELFRSKYFSNSPCYWLHTLHEYHYKPFLAPVIIFQFPIGVFIPFFIPGVCLCYWGCNVAQQWHWHISILADHRWFSSPLSRRSQSSSSLGARATISLNTKQNQISTLRSLLIFYFMQTCNIFTEMTIWKIKDKT